MPNSVDIVGQSRTDREVEAMKKIKWAFVAFILIIGIALRGCGTSSESSTYTDEAPAVADDAAIDNGTMADFNEEQLKKQAEEAETWVKAPNDADISELTIDEVIDNVLNYAESEGMIIVDEDSINDIIELMYITEGYDAFEIFQHLCNDGKIVSVPIAPEGIIVLSYNGPTVAFSSFENNKGKAITVNLDCINPDTGDVQHLRTFYSEDAYRCYPGFNGLGANTTLSLMHFNSDLTQMTAAVTLDDGSIHVGWIEENGKFTDVSAMVTADTGDFSALTNHSNPCFGPKGYFYFRDSTNSNVQDKRVPLDNLTVSAVETLVDDVDYLGLPLYPFPDGTVEDTIWDKNYYYDESMTYPVKGNFFDDWISQSECVGIYNDNIIYKYSLSGIDDGFDSWYDEKIAIVPDIKGRTNRNPVVSPDRTKVAFLSALTTGTDTSPYLYIVPVDGDNPVKVSTNYVFSDATVFTSYSGGFNSTILLAWE